MFYEKKKKKTLENFLLFYLENDRINKCEMKKEKVNTNNRSTIWNILFQVIYFLFSISNQSYPKFVSIYRSRINF